MKNVLIIAGAVAFLAGCQHNKPIAELSYTEVKELAAVIAQRCVDQGVQRNSPQWDACTKQEISREDTRRNRAARKEDSSVMCHSFGAMTVCN